MRWAFFRGVTCYEGYVGRLWFRWPYWKFLLSGARPSFGWEAPVMTDADAFEYGASCAVAGGQRSEAVRVAGIVGGQGWDWYWEEYGQ